MKKLSCQLLLMDDVLTSLQRQEAFRNATQGRSSRSEVVCNGRRGFVKIGTGGEAATSAMLDYEAMGLEHLRAACSSITVPNVWHVGTLLESEGGSAYIVMDWLSLGRCGRAHQAALGAGLAAMHSAPPHSTWPATRFGFPVDGCCGAGPQPNNPEKRALNWVEFWSEYRLGSMLERAPLRLRASRELSTMLELGAQLQKRLPEFFAATPVEDIAPSVCHGDLWSGNVGLDNETGRPAIFDPAAYYGDAEADLGIARMFGGFHSEFYDAYHAVRPQRPGYEARAQLYELHHHLNHACIFGDGYLGGCIQLMKSLLRGEKTQP